MERRASSSVPSVRASGASPRGAARLRQSVDMRWPRWQEDRILLRFAQVRDLVELLGRRHPADPGPRTGGVIGPLGSGSMTISSEPMRSFCQAPRDSGDRTRSSQGHEVGVLRGVQAVLEDRLDRRLLASHQGGWIEPQAGKHGAAQMRSAAGGLSSERPRDSRTSRPGDQGPARRRTAGAVAPVGVELFPEVVTGAAGRDFRDQLGRSLYVIILADAGLPPRSGWMIR